MQTIRAFYMMLLFGVMTLCVFNGCSDPMQKLAAADLKTSKVVLQRNQRQFENAMASKIALFRRSLDEMKALADNATGPTKITINLQCADMERHLEVIETGVEEFKAMRTGNQWRSVMEF